MASQKKVLSRKPQPKAAAKGAKKPVAKKPVPKKPAAKPVAKKAAKPVAKKVAAKPVAKKPVAKKPVAKKPVAKKPVAKAPAKKAPAKKPVAKPVAKKPAPKPVAKKVAAKPVAKKPAPKKPVPAKKAAVVPAKKPAPAAPAKKAPAPVKKPVAPAKKVPAPAKKPVAPAKKPAPAPAPKKPSPAAKKPTGNPTPKSTAKPRAYTAQELAIFRVQLVQQLELVHGNLRALSADNLKRSPVDANGDISTHSTHMADHGTDNFDRELALNLASGRQESLYDIEDAIRRIDEGTYGVCESCGGPIEHPRLKALPFAKKCVACQNASERGRTRYRPFGGTLAMQQYNTPDESAHDEPQE